MSHLQCYDPTMNPSHFCTVTTLLWILVTSALLRPSRDWYFSYLTHLIEVGSRCLYIPFHIHLTKYFISIFFTDYCCCYHFQRTVSPGRPRAATSSWWDCWWVSQIQKCPLSLSPIPCHSSTNISHLSDIVLSAWFSIDSLFSPTFFTFFTFSLLCSHDPCCPHF